MPRGRRGARPGAAWAVLALLSLHARAGVRLAWRAAIPVFTAPTLAVGMSPDPNAALQGLARGAASPDGGVAVPLRIIWRALPGRWGLSYAPSGLCLAITALFIRNNALAPADVSMVTRLGGGLAVVGSTALLAKLIAVRRPPWPWARSLPRSSLRRVGEDATFLALAALPVLAVSSVMDGAAAASLVLMLPYIVVRALVALRASDSPLGGAVVFVELMLAVGVLTLIPSLAFVSVAALPVAVAHAVRAERRHRAGRWTETDHLGRGDTQAWSGQ